MKSLFPQEMLSSASGDLSPDVIANRLTYFHVQLQDLHWATKNDAEHRALGGLYEYVFEAKDGIIEKIMGYARVKARAGDIKGIKPYSPGLSNQIVTELELFAKQLQSYGASNRMPDIENLAQSLSGQAALTIDLLTRT